MALVKYILEDSSEVTIEAQVGHNLMQLAIENNVEGIEGACGGSCMCATCHVKVESVNGAELGERSEMELDVLEMEIDEVASNSRLGCQIEINEKIESITVRIESIQSI